MPAALWPSAPMATARRGPANAAVPKTRRWQCVRATPWTAPSSNGSAPLADSASRRADLWCSITIMHLIYSVLVLLEHAPGLKQWEAAASPGIQRANFVALCDRLQRHGAPAAVDSFLRALFGRGTRKGACSRRQKDPSNS